jgi:two-component system OmpR family response regulator
MSGYELLKAVHSKYSGIPAMALTAQAEEEARIRGIESGFDDYMTKPFQNVELAARLEVLIRRRDMPTAKVITLGKLQIEPAKMSVKYKNQDIQLTKTEFRILEVIARAYPAPVAKNKLLTTVWDRNDNGNYDKLLMAISRLRKKLDNTNPNLIKVENGGYKLNL